MKSTTLLKAKNFKKGKISLNYSSLFFVNGKKPRDILSLLSSIQGIESIEFDHRIGTINVHYNSGLVSENKIVQLLKKNLFSSVTKSFNPSSNGGDEGVLPFDLYSENGNLPAKQTFTKFGERYIDWKIIQNLPGRLRIRHDLLIRKEEYCLYVERALMRVLEVKSYKVSSITSSVLVIYISDCITPQEIISILDEALFNALEKGDKTNKNLRIPLTTASLAFSVGSAFWAPWLLPVSVGLVAWTSLPIVKRAFKSLFEKKKIKVDILDATVIFMCLIMNQAATAAFMVWIVDIANGVFSRTSKHSHRLLSQIFGRESRFAYLLKDGQEIKVSVHILKKGDLIVVKAGEQIPIDGIVTSGEAVVDQHALTGESAPVEKSKGEKVLAATTAIAGSLTISVLEAGENTNANKIVKIIEQASSSPVKIQSFAEKMADRMVIPTLGLAAAGGMTTGSSASLAIVNSDFGTGIRIASPLAVLSTIAKAARHGILIKKGIVLEILPNASTVIFDKTGTLTQETPEVAKVILANGCFTEEQVLIYAAAAEQRFSHPIAKAILERAHSLELPLPKMDESKYHVGFGIQVGINGDIIKVGSPRFMQKEKIFLNNKTQIELNRIMSSGRTGVLVSVNDEIAGLLELKSSHRPEALDLIQSLNDRGINTILISGDQEAATQEIAEKLQMKDYFAEVLPQEKGKYVRKYQRGGHLVAMVGDGINDSIALSQADVSISLKGASDMATDVADVIFMDGSLMKFQELMEISEQLRKNVTRSFGTICVANSVGIAGAFLGVFGLPATLILNNGVNMIATANSMIPLFETIDEIPDDEITQSKRS